VVDAAVSWRSTTDGKEKTAVSTRVFADPVQAGCASSLMPWTGAPLGLADCFREQESLPRAFARVHGDNLKFP
jgi:hypothetical protein